MCIFYVCKSNWWTLQDIQDSQQIENIISKCSFLYSTSLPYFRKGFTIRRHFLPLFIIKKKKKGKKQNLSLISFYEVRAIWNISNHLSYVWGSTQMIFLVSKRKKNLETFKNLAVLIMCVARWAVHSYNAPLLSKVLKLTKISKFPYTHSQDYYFAFMKIG